MTTITILEIIGDLKDIYKEHFKALHSNKA
jgi:hypothetical protein